MTGSGSAEDAQEDPYLLGTDAEERRRLETQHHLWADWTHDLWDRAGFGIIAEKR